MTETKRKAYRLVVVAVALASIMMFAEGCNTSQPPNQQGKDSQITTEVKAKLASKVRASSLTNVEVNTTNGVVTLAGQVENADIRRSAEQLWIGDPAEIKAKRVKKQKYDREDARLLLRLMREDNFPKIWVPSPENLHQSMPVPVCPSRGDLANC
jgi:hypothetical protein